VLSTHFAQNIHLEKSRHRCPSTTSAACYEDSIKIVGLQSRKVIFLRPVKDDLGQESGCMECIIREATEIELYPDNLNREEGSSLSKSWKPLLETLKEQKRAIFKER